MKASQQPANWTSGLSPLAILGMFVCIGAAVYSVAETVVAVTRGSALAASTAGGLAVFFMGILGSLAVTLFVPAANYSDYDSAGTTVRVHPAIVWLYAVALCGAAIGSSLYLWSVWRGIRDLPFTSTGDGRVARTLLIALLVLSVTGLIALARSRESGYLRLGISGVGYGDLFRTRSARWEDVVDIADKADMRSRSAIVFHLRNGRPIVVANADRFSSGGSALYWMVRHYWQRPDDRSALVDGRALERLRDDGFDPG